MRNNANSLLLLSFLFFFFSKYFAPLPRNAPQHPYTVEGFKPDDPTNKFVKLPLFSDVCRLVANGSHFPEEIQKVSLSFVPFFLFEALECACRCTVLS